jgi:S-adenosylmethionine decarboxylase
MMTVGKEKFDNYHGKHWIIEVYASHPFMLHEGLCEDLLTKAALAAGAKILGANFHHFGDGCGVTGVLLLAESHISVHTWPENKYAALDIFLCGNCDPEAAMQYIEDTITDTDPEAEFLVMMIDRGGYDNA